MRLAARTRVVLARRPWIYWLVVGLLAAGLGAIVHEQLARVDEARRAWSETRRVFVADRDLSPGEPLAVTSVELPVAALPATAVDELPTDVVLRRSLVRGEVLVDADIGSGRGPAARAGPGTVVVPISDPLVTTAEHGLTVAVYAEGLVLAETATIVDTADEIVFVAVEPTVAPAVAAAVRQRTASIAFTP